ncbi:hypothetical protein DYB32_002333 [Aphanomyces invadans]|uniref:ribonuclease H n=1 Tax=Aphanomyces invadans TaxID=157072 RepID=A0A3R6Z2R5_9STRA|nr:hypothetical protein DYB32_002333 [Aphanomyces invadans]
MPFYAVAAGRSRGIFTAWDNGAKEQVTGYPSAIFKKFNTEAEAERFLNQHDNVVLRKRPRLDDGIPSEATTVAPLRTRQRTDAAPLGNGSAARRQPHYVVSKGHSTGVFATWGDVEGAILNFPQPEFRKFSTKHDADAYWARHRPEPTGSILKTVPVVATSSRSQAAACPAPGTTNAPPTKYYALAKGRKGVRGIFSSWADVEPHVTNYFNATYKSFSSLEEAETYIRAQAAVAVGGTMGTLATDPDPLDPSTLVAFCDGSAIGNGKVSCRAAFACVFPHNESWNVAEKLPMGQAAAATNNRAEYLAALEALKRANIQDPSQIQPLYIFSDSMLLIRSLTEWLPTWIKNNWRKADGEAYVMKN